MRAMSNDSRRTIRIHIPEEFVGFSIQELLAVGGTIESLTSSAPGRQTIEGIIPGNGYDSLVRKISEYVGSNEATFELVDPRN